MFTDHEVNFLRECSGNYNYSPDERLCFSEILAKIALTHTAPKPEIIVTIEDGCYQYAHANTEVTLIIEDIDAIKDNAGELFYTSPVTEDYDLYLRKAKMSTKLPREVRIFIHDPEDQFPYQVMIDGEVIQTLETMQDALTYLQTQIG